jgi:DNA repair exonuclease SbcCD nuclease subunit
MFRFLHAADIHLDSPLRGLERYEGAPVDQLRGATRRALENLVELAIDESVALVLIAGDLYDGDWREFRTGLFFCSQMARLREAGIEVLVIAGNHDAANKMTLRLPLPENVRILSHKRPETVTLDDLGVAVHGQSFARATVLENLAAGYPVRAGGLFNLGLLHTCADGREGHDRYAPCCLDDLRGKEYDYWALGHVHAREVLWDEPPVIFAGNLQGRHIREAGPKGCMLVTVDDDHRSQAEFRALDVLRWEICRVDLSRLATPDDVLDRVQTQLEDVAAGADKRPVAVRVRLVGASRVHRQLAAEPQRVASEIRAIAQTVAGGMVWVEKVLQQTTPESLPESAAPADGPMGELLRYVRELKGDPDGLRALAGQLSDLVAKLPPELKEGPGALKLDQPESLCHALDEVEQLLLHRLLGGRASG